MECRIWNKSIERYISYIFVAVFGLLFFGLMQWNRTLLDPDAFYHAKISLLMLEQGIVRDFPWLAFTVLTDAFTDHHFLYHIFLLPFVKFFHPLVGIKIATAIINTAFIVLFYAFLRSQKIRWAFFYVFLLLSSAPFIFRINLVKANGFSLVFIMLILFALFKRKYLWLGILSFFYVWAYGGWPIGIMLAIIFVCATFMSNLIMECGVKKSLLHCYIVALLKLKEWRAVIATGFGSLAGLVINPYFPENLKFYWHQIVQIAVVNYSSKIGVGAEWYSFDFAELFSYSGLVFLVFGFGMLLFILSVGDAERRPIKLEKIRNIFFFTICAGAFFILTLKSKRYSEYAYPFMVLASAFLINTFYSKEIYLRIKKNFLRIFKFRVFYKIFLVFIAVLFILSFGANFWRIKTGLGEGFSFGKYKEAMDVAQENSEFGDMIFHSDWDDWPMLFYYNVYNRYIVGLDATFMYKKSPELYKKWREICWDKFEGDSYPVIKDEFGAKLIFIAEWDIERMDEQFKNDERYELIYEGDGKVYKVE